MSTNNKFSGRNKSLRQKFLDTSFGSWLAPHYAQFKDWSGRKLEIHKIKGQIKKQNHWLDEMYRQMGEKISASDVLPAEDELQRWRQSIKSARHDILMMFERIEELDNPELAKYRKYDTKPNLIVGGAVADYNAEIDDSLQSTSEVPSVLDVEDVTDIKDITPVDGYVELAEAVESQPSQSSKSQPEVSPSDEAVAVIKDESVEPAPETEPVESAADVVVTSDSQPETAKSEVVPAADEEVTPTSKKVNIFSADE